ncbi:MAG: glycosyltransferase, partial [Leptospiraceae bacterium]|nr:glycosyltransferase [Leptospiraceae bacterium]
MLLPDLRGGGAERVWLNLGKVFSKKGYLVEFVVMRKTGELIEELPARVRLVDLNAFRIRDSIFPLKRYFREAKPDVTLIAMWPLTIIAIIAGILSGSKTKVFVSDHEHLSLSNA